MKHYAIIPARAGSKSIVNKNLMKVGSKHLVDWAVSSALNSNVFEKVILTTDISSLFDEYKDFKEVACHQRSDDLCLDQTAMRPVIQDVINAFEILSEDYIWLLQPTSPFRKDRDYKKIIGLLSQPLVKSVISVKLVREHPSQVYVKQNGQLTPIRKHNHLNKQDLPEMYWRNGAFYVAKVEDYLRWGTFWLHKCLPYEMEDHRSINIDSPFDLFLARQIEKNYKSE